MLYCRVLCECWQVFTLVVPQITAAVSNRSYLELADWVLEDAIHSAWEDGEWQKEDVKTSNKCGGDIRIMVNLKNGVPIGFRAQGAGDTVPYGKFDSRNSSPVDSDRIESVASGVDMTIYEDIPTSVSKNVSAQDVYKVSLMMWDCCKRLTCCRIYS